MLLFVSRTRAFRSSVVRIIESAFRPVSIPSSKSTAGRVGLSWLAVSPEFAPSAADAVGASAFMSAAQSDRRCDPTYAPVPYPRAAHAFLLNTVRHSAPVGSKGKIMKTATVKLGRTFSMLLCLLLPALAHAETRIEALGAAIFNDTNLSEPAGVACASCHLPFAGNAGNNGSAAGVPKGSRGVLGVRNSMSSAYAATTPSFTFHVFAGRVEPAGGLSWDGRADKLSQQAQSHLFNPAEMNNKDAAGVVAKVASSAYANQFKAEFGANIFSTPDAAFQRILQALTAFEASSAQQPYTSKFDQFIRGKATLSAAEERGLKLFTNPQKANCASCHPVNPTSRNPADSTFTRHGFFALGVPRNTAIPANGNPSYFDLGLCGPVRNKPALTAEVPVNVTIEQFCGSFKTPSLRNVALRPAFMHNGVFRNLTDVVSFYATRNSDPVRWYGSRGVPNDLPMAYQGNIVRDRAPFNRPASAGPALTPAEIGDVVAFLKTLTDGYGR